jgi:hypothetical protein
LKQLPIKVEYFIEHYGTFVTVLVGMTGLGGVAYKIMVSQIETTQRLIRLEPLTEKVDNLTSIIFEKKKEWRFNRVAQSAVL